MNGTVVAVFEVLLGKDGCAKTVHCVPIANERRNERPILEIANLCFKNVLMVKRPLSLRFSNKSISQREREVRNGVKDTPTV